MIITDPKVKDYIQRNGKAVAKLKFWFGDTVPDLFSDKYDVIYRDLFVIVYETLEIPNSERLFPLSKRSCETCTWENLIEEFEPCRSCFKLSNWAPKTWDQKEES